MEELNEIKQALEKATHGPWYAIRTEVFVELGPIAKLWGEGPKGEFSFDNYENNAQLIANAPEWLSSLITTIESQKEEIERLHDALVSIVDGNWSCSFYENGLEVWSTNRINPSRIAFQAISYKQEGESHE